MLRTGLDAGLARVGLETRPITLVRPSPLWEEDPAFMAVVGRIEALTLLDHARLHILWQCALHARGLSGLVAEVGVYRGGTALLLAEALAGAGKTLHLFDTFTGLPPPDPSREDYVEHYLSDTSEAAVRQLLAPHGSAAQVHPGLFPATAAPIAGERFALVHIDVDLYRSTLDCCELFWPRLVDGGRLVVDDYGFCPGARAAVDEYFAGREVRPLYLTSGQCLILRR